MASRVYMCMLNHFYLLRMIDSKGTPFQADIEEIGVMQQKAKHVQRPTLIK